jgi:ATP-dependent Clp protease adaptor protein ClpS
MATATTPDIETQRSDADTTGEGWRTVLYNCNCHEFEEVIDQLMEVLPCSFAEARRYAEIAHGTGKVTVCRGSRARCEDVALGLAVIGLQVSVEEG